MPPFLARVRGLDRSTIDVDADRDDITIVRAYSRDEEHGNQFSEVRLSVAGLDKLIRSLTAVRDRIATVKAYAKVTGHRTAKPPRKAVRR